MEGAVWKEAAIPCGTSSILPHVMFETLLSREVGFIT